MESQVTTNGSTPLNSKVLAAGMILCVLALVLAWSAYQSGQDSRDAEVANLQEESAKWRDNAIEAHNGLNGVRNSGCQAIRSLRTSVLSDSVFVFNPPTPGELQVNTTCQVRITNEDILEGEHGYDSLYGSIRAASSGCSDVVVEMDVAEFSNEWDAVTGNKSPYIVGAEVVFDLGEPGAIWSAATVIERIERIDKVLGMEYGDQLAEFQAWNEGC